MKNKRMMSAAIAVLMAGSLAACGGSTTASSTADSTPASTASLPHLYRSAFTNFHMGYSCALAWILVVIIGLATAILFKTQNAWVHYEAE